jgi:hypothetical protein
MYIYNQRILPSTSLETPTDLVGPGFPFDAPSKLSLTKSWGGGE